MAKKEGKTSMVVWLDDKDHVFARKLQLEREVEGIVKENGKKENLTDVVETLIKRGIKATK